MTIINKIRFLNRIESKGGNFIINIIDINLGKIEKEIYYNYAKKGIEPDYCIMNEDTFNIIKDRLDSLGIMEEIIAKTSNKPIPRKIFGVDIDICENLKFGEVDIR